MAGEWLRLNTTERRSATRLRFDAIAVALTPDGRAREIEHVRDAF
jgi:hypothetical protein